MHLLRYLEVLVVNVARSRRVDSDEAIFAAILDQSVTQYFFKATVEGSELLNDLLLFVLSDPVIRVALASILIFSAQHAMLGRCCRIQMADTSLVRLGPHDVLETILHLCYVVAPSIKFAQAHQIHRIEEQLRLNLEVEWGLSR